MQSEISMLQLLDLNFMLKYGIQGVNAAKDILKVREFIFVDLIMTKNRVYHWFIIVH